jgi:hypothetical protein
MASQSQESLPRGSLSTHLATVSPRSHFLGSHSALTWPQPVPRSHFLGSHSSLKWPQPVPRSHFLGSHSVLKWPQPVPRSHFLGSHSVLKWPQPVPRSHFLGSHSVLTWPQPVTSWQFCSHFNSTISEAEWVHSSNPCRCDWVQQIYMRSSSLTSPVRRICAPE